VGHERDAESEANVLGGPRERADDHLGGGRVGAPLAEVVLDVPAGVEPELVGEQDLLEGLLVRPLLGLPLTVGVLPGPRLGDINLVEQVQLHGSSSFV
jgi:hypothetical protein